MPTYATSAELTDYVADTPAAASLPTDLDALLGRAERDVDSILITPVPGGRETTGLRVDPASLPDWQAQALSRATCAQAEYRVTMGEEFFVRAQHDRVYGPDFRTDGQLPHIGPKVERELAGTGLVRTEGVRSLRAGTMYSQLLPLDVGDLLP
jgi:hypothetical protein